MGVVDSGFEDFSTKWNDGVLSMISDLGSNIESTDFGTIVDQIIELFECDDVAHLAEKAEQASPTSINALSQIMTEDEKLTLDDSSSQLDSDAMKPDSNDTPIG